MNSHIFTKVLAVTALMSIMSFPRSYIWLKVTLLILYFVQEFILWVRGKSFKFSPVLVSFYTAIMFAGLVWSIVGVSNGSPAEAIFDYLRLYVVWSLAYLVLFSLLRGAEGRNSLHIALVASGYVISIINLIGVADSFFELSLISDEVRAELFMNIGFHEGYVQITSHNIGSLFFVASYLYALQLSKSNIGANLSIRIAFILVILVSILSGRRALWLVLLSVPIFDYALVKLLGHDNRSRAGSVLLLSTVLGVFGLLFFVVLGSGSFESHTFEHVLSAFSPEDERSIQKGYLVQGFLEYPLMGSGFGGFAGYVRNEGRQWLYELTYHQMLFNFGLIGSIYMLSVVGLFTFKAMKRIGQCGNFYEIDKALLIGAFAILVGSYSNPYLGSFDFLLYFGIIPYLAVPIKLR